MQKKIFRITSKFWRKSDFKTFWRTVRPYLDFSKCWFRTINYESIDNIIIDNIVI
jgi:hypothetical protein